MATMGLPSRMFPTDEELGKRDDDHRPIAPKTWWAAGSALPYLRRRRLAISLVAILLFWLLYHSVLSGASVQSITAPENAAQQDDRSGALVAPTGAPPRSSQDDTASTEHYYNGHIRFFELGASLHAVSGTGGLRPNNRNVLFAASNLQSVSALIPLACEMAKWDRNYVHFTIMGRYDLTLAEILEVNGVDRRICGIAWHDARPDYVLYSSDYRAEAVVTSAMAHIQNFVHPQAVITDDSVREDVFFTKGVRSRAEMYNLPVIEIPKDQAENFEWITRLDSGSLKSWHLPSIDILIHASAESSGSLIRLIKSLESADYAGMKPPRLIIELPANIDAPTQQYLDTLVWPPSKTKKSPLEPDSIVLTHRITNQKISGEEASVRFLETFYPPKQANSHVLLLSTNVELSPQYYHYLRFNLLEYKYSTFGSGNTGNLFGISLEIPAYYLNGTTDFVPLGLDAMLDPKYAAKGEPDDAIPFLWQAPNSNAALYFGDKWKEIHSFLRFRLAAFHSQKEPTPRPRTIHESQPSWMEYMLELMRVRGYSMLYPGISPSRALVSVHNELYQPPEEHSSPETHDTPPTTPDPDHDEPPPSAADAEPFLTGSMSPPPPRPSTPEPPLAAANTPLHLLLPFNADPPELAHMPELSHSGDLLSAEDSKQLAEDVTARFREAIGRCPAPPEGMFRRVVSGSARDLFCLGDDDDGDFESLEPPVMEVEIIEGGAAAETSAAVAAAATTAAAMTAQAAVGGTERNIERS
ncbi:hypothetical protein K490DRAFT_60632 [Saccharata proteae CBS 121410]|uniref:Glycosyltransferase 2 n=1 Tax=Saccharata proteae CBS 121410 TaxID=1314787 RepID=A0A9P4HMF7_9PEZI|nr:hypothetical protein K490DRAFT_60632 [Saccharata proteae CBS 121410]